MFLVASSLVIGRATVAAMLAALNARPAGALLTTPTLHLGDGTPPALTPDSNSTGYTEATFTGYAAVALTVFSGVVNVQPSVQAITADTIFTAAAPLATPGNATFWWIDTGSAGPIYFAGAFDATVPFANPGDFLAMQTLFPAMNQFALNL